MVVTWCQSLHSLQRLAIAERGHTKDTGEELPRCRRFSRDISIDTCVRRVLLVHVATPA